MMAGRTLSGLRRSKRAKDRLVEELEPRLLLSASSLTNTSPWGIGSSAEASGYYKTFMPKMEQAGIQWIRTGFTFGDIEPSPGVWNWGAADTWVNYAEYYGLNPSGLILGTPSWVNSDTKAFPTANLQAWKDFVTAVVNRYKNTIGYWEIWNEPENFASDGTPQQYGQTVAAAYDAIKAADPTAQVGMSVASVDLAYLQQAINGGAKDHFDYIVVHPYETFGTMNGQEPLYMSIVPTVHKMLSAIDPAKAEAPVWVTEIGENTAGSGNQAQQSAQDLVKGYAMGIAEGFAHIEWFDAMGADPYNDGLLNGSGTPLTAYTAYQNMTRTLGATPEYLGWVQLNGRDYGFVFQNGASTVLVTWAPSGMTDSVNFGSTVSVMNPLTGQVVTGSSYTLTNAPVFVTGTSAQLVAQAEFNKTLAFPWNGDNTGALSATVTMGSPNTEAGLHQLNADGSSNVVTVNGVTARDASKSNSQVFTIDPNFLSYTGATITISVVVQRKPGASDAPGFNLWYESPSGWSGGPGWYTVPSGSQWYTKTYTLTDDMFVGRWGYSFRFESDSTTYSQYYIRSVTVTKSGNVSTAAPAGVSLVTTDDAHRTDLNNSSAGKKLSFDVSGTLAGSRVYLYFGTTLLGSALATGPVTRITTDGYSTLADGSYSVTAKQAADAKVTSAASPGLSLIVDTSAPTVTGVVVNDGSAQRSMVTSLTVTFSEAVTLFAGALVLQHQDGSAVAAVNLSVSNPSGDGKTYVVMFSGTGVVGGSLADGSYQLVVKGGLAQDVAGNALAADVTHAFFRLYGDANGDGTVNSVDNFQLRNTFGLSLGTSGYLWYLDSNGDGTVNSIDNFQFRSRFGVVID